MIISQMPIRLNKHGKGCKYTKGVCFVPKDVMDYVGWENQDVFAIICKGGETFSFFELKEKLDEWAKKEKLIEELLEVKESEV